MASVPHLSGRYILWKKPHVRQYSICSASGDVMDNEDIISVKGKTFRIDVERCSGSLAKVSIKNGAILMKFPRRMSSHEMEKTYSNFREWSVKRLMKIDLSELEPKPKYVEFYDGQELEVLWKSFRIRIKRTGSKTGRARITPSGEITVMIPESMAPEESSMAAYHAIRRLVSRNIKDDLLLHVKGLNARHFNHEFSKVTIRDQATRWGSCSRSTGNISLNFRLLMAPDPVRDYVIIHELAHLRHPNHSKRFWKLVESADPLFRENRKWLRINGNRIGLQDPPAMPINTDKQKILQ